MKRTIPAFINLVAAAGLALLLTACGGSGGGDSTGSLSLSLTDAPIDSALEVVVRFDGVELQPSDGERIMFYLADTTGSCEVVATHDPANPCAIDLTEYQGVDKVTILNNVTIPAGEYSWFRLILNDDPGYILTNEGQFDLRVPSGAQTGLKLHGGFIVAAGSLTNYTIDFDLRKSVHLPMNGWDEYTLRPTLRIMDESMVGTLTGNIGDALIMTGATGGGDCVGAVYVFDNGGGLAIADDIDGTDDPVTTAMVPDDGVNDYTVGYLTEGDYLVAFTCDAGIDTAGVDDPAVAFLSEAPVTIMADTVTMQDLPPTP